MQIFKVTLEFEVRAEDPAKASKMVAMYNSTPEFYWAQRQAEVRGEASVKITDCTIKEVGQ